MISKKTAVAAILITTASHACGFTCTGGGCSPRARKGLWPSRNYQENKDQGAQYFVGRRDKEFPVLNLQSTRPTTTDTPSGGSNSTATVLAHADEMKHKLVVLEDVVERLHRQKSQLKGELKESQSTLENTKAKLEAATTREREIVSTERRKHRMEVQELKERLEAAEEAKSIALEKSREKFAHAKEKAIEEHKRLEAKADKLGDLLGAAQSKLDVYRRESYERETKLRQSLREEHEARQTLEALKEKAVEEAEIAKAAMAEQKTSIDETLMISEAAVAAADRRERDLKNDLEQAQAEIASFKANTTNTPAEADGSTQMKKKAKEIKELQDQILSMHQKFESERQRERQKWGREIEALQEALEIARSKAEPPAPTIPSENQAPKTNIIRRIRRKILHK